MITPMLFAKKGSISFRNILGGRLIIVIYVETLTLNQFDVFAAIRRIRRCRIRIMVLFWCINCFWRINGIQRIVLEGLRH